MDFRDLRADEIECRVSTVSEKGCSLLLYKDARCDMNILDETVGKENWQRHHTRDNANCIVSIWSDAHKQWIDKEDTGTESYTEKEKGLASDSFKRACFNWGIGRELYTAPFIWVSSDKCNIKNGNNGKPTTYDRFAVDSITICNKKITALSIRNLKTGMICYTFGATSSEPVKPLKAGKDQLAEIAQLITDTNSDLAKMLAYFKVQKIEELTQASAMKCIDMLRKKLK